MVKALACKWDLTTSSPQCKVGQAGWTRHHQTETTRGCKQIISIIEHRVLNQLGADTQDLKAAWAAGAMGDRVGVQVNWKITCEMTIQNSTKISKTSTAQSSKIVKDKKLQHLLIILMALLSNKCHNHPTSNSNNKYKTVELVAFSKIFSALNLQHSQRVDSQQIKISTASMALQVATGRWLEWIKCHRLPWAKCLDSKWRLVVRWIREQWVSFLLKVKEWATLEASRTWQMLEITSWVSVLSSLEHPLVLELLWAIGIWTKALLWS